MLENYDFIKPLIDPYLTKLNLLDYKTELINKVNKFMYNYNLNNNENDKYDLSYNIKEFSKIHDSNLINKINEIEKLLDDKDKFIIYKKNLLDLIIFTFLKIIKMNIFHSQNKDILHLVYK
jgi:hypothetical protein